MAIVYLTYDGEVELKQSDETTKQFRTKLGPKDRTVSDFQLGKAALQVYHNEFLSGGHFVENTKGIQYVIKGVSKMTVKPKIAETLLSGPTQWVLTKVRVDHDDEADNRTVLRFEPAVDGSSIMVVATLEKPSL